MNVSILEGPAAEPLSLAEVKAYLRIAYAGDDGLVAGLIASARARIEREAGLALITRNLRVSLDAWPAGTVETRTLRLPVRPSDSLIAVHVRNAEGGEDDVTSRFILEPGRSARLVWTNGAFPWTARYPGAVKVDYAAGFGLEAGDVVEDLTLAIKRLVAHAYQARDAETIAAPLPADVTSLLAPWRRVQL